MKKLLALAIIAGSIGFSTVSATANTSASANAAQQTMMTTRVKPNGRVVRTVTQTRRVRVGRQVYRETYQTKYQPNGRVTTRIISRVRVR